MHTYKLGICISSGAEYVILKSKNWMKKSQNMPVWVRKIVWLSIIIHFVVAEGHLPKTITK